MKTQKHIVSALALVLVTAGAALAGPSNPSGSFADNVGIAARKANGCPMISSVTKGTANANTKTHVLAPRVTGYKHDGCVTDKTGNMVCKPSGTSCAKMRQG